MCQKCCDAWNKYTLVIGEAKEEYEKIEIPARSRLMRERSGSAADIKTARKRYHKDVDEAEGTYNIKKQQANEAMLKIIMRHESIKKHITLPSK